MRALTALALLCAGCTTMYDPCFAPASLVSDLRVLAVRADPPEVLFDPATFDAPPVVVRALVAFPAQTPQPVTIRARLCSRTQDDGSCSTPGPWQAQASGTQDALPRVSLRLTPALVRDAYQADPLQGYGGARITIELEAESPGRGAVRAHKLLLASPDLPGYVPNHGLEIADVAVIAKDGSELAAGSVPQVPLFVGESVGLAPQLAPGDGGAEAAEAYTVRDLSGQIVQLRERISYSFYVTPHAQFGPIGRPLAGADEADEPAPGEPRPAGGLVLLSPLYEETGRVYVVARDGRGGEAFAFFDINMTDQRACMRGDVPTKCASLEIGCL